LSSQEFKELDDPTQLNPHTLEDTLRQLKGFRSTFVPPQSRQEGSSSRRSFSQGVQLFEAALKPDGVQRLVSEQICVLVQYSYSQSSPEDG
jgi:hypothetical protein